MNQISFSLKRAFRLNAELGFSLMGEFGLTPSRFELLMVISNDARVWLQSHVRERLGVNRTTVSRFVKALAAAGLVSRHRDPEFDARSWVVELTEEGRQCLLRVKEMLFEQGLGEVASDRLCFVTQERRRQRQQFYASANDARSNQPRVRVPEPIEPTRQSLQRLLRPLELVREALGDCATLLYPARPRRRRAPSVLWLFAAGTPTISDSLSLTRSAPLTSEAPAAKSSA